MTKSTENFMQYAEEHLMKSELFRNTSDMSIKDVPSVPGMYAIEIVDKDLIRTPYSDELRKRKHNLLYIGIGRESLRERLWREELNNHKSATFFRSIGAVIGFRPKPGTLKSGSNYKFSKDDTEKIRQWLREHTKVNYITHPSVPTLEETEIALISKYKPIINIKDNPYSIDELSEIREECKRIAKSKA